MDQLNQYEPERTRKYRPIIEGKIADLKTALSETDSSAAPVSPVNGIGPLSRDDAMQQQQVALELLHEMKHHLTRLERAKKLINNGEYGACAKCEEDIDVSRLNVLPDAIFCVSCSEELDRI